MQALQQGHGAWVVGVTPVTRMSSTTVRDKPAGQALKDLMQETGLNPEVRERAQWALGQMQ